MKRPTSDTKRLKTAQRRRKQAKKHQEWKKRANSLQKKGQKWIDNGMIYDDKKGAYLR